MDPDLGDRICLCGTVWSQTDVRLHGGGESCVTHMTLCGWGVHLYDMDQNDI